MNNITIFNSQNSIVGNEASVVASNIVCALRLGNIYRWNTPTEKGNEERKPCLMDIFDEDQQQSAEIQSIGKIKHNQKDKRKIVSELRALEIEFSLMTNR